MLRSRVASAQPGAASAATAAACERLDRCAVADSPDRRASFAVDPGQRVRSFDVVTALLPLSSGASLRTYKIAVAVGVAIPLIAAAFGWIPFALGAAALAVPAIFTIYLYDANEWEDEPVPVVLGCLILSGALGAGASWVIEQVLLGADERLGVGAAIDGGFQIRPVLVYGVVTPLVAVVLGLLAPLVLASRPRFDDMIDGLTFGAVSGAAYAAGDTLMAHRGVLETALGERGDVATWLSVVANAAAVKPLLYGTALAIAAASFSGIGAGYEGFGRRFAKGLGIAVVGMVGYGVGVALLAQWLDPTPAAALGLAWGLIVTGALVLVLRTQLHLGLLEAALEAARGTPEPPRGHRRRRCGRCEMALAPLALFCSACGASVRATTKTRRRENTAIAPRCTSERASLRASEPSRRSSVHGDDRRIERGAAVGCTSERGGGRRAARHPHRVHPRLVVTLVIVALLVAGVVGALAAGFGRDGDDVTGVGLRPTVDVGHPREPRPRRRPAVRVPAGPGRRATPAPSVRRPRPPRPSSPSPASTRPPSRCRWNCRCRRSRWCCRPSSRCRRRRRRSPPWPSTTSIRTPSTASTDWSVVSRSGDRLTMTDGARVIEVVRLAHAADATDALSQFADILTDEFSDLSPTPPQRLSAPTNRFTYVSGSQFTAVRVSQQATAPVTGSAVAGVGPDGAAVVVAALRDGSATADQLAADGAAATAVLAALGPLRLRPPGRTVGVVGYRYLWTPLALGPVTRAQPHRLLRPPHQLRP